jgi:hypothetical protein
MMQYGAVGYHRPSATVDIHSLPTVERLGPTEKDWVQMGSVEFENAVTK